MIKRFIQNIESYIWMVPRRVWHVGDGSEDDDEDEVDDGGEDAADGAPADRHRQHAVHAEHDELKISNERILSGTVFQLFFQENCDEILPWKVIENMK